MQQRVPKDIYVDQLTKKVQKREQLRRYYTKNYLPILRKFDGKVYNARFVNAINEDMERHDALLHITDMTDNDDKTRRLWMYVCESATNYNRAASIMLRVVCNAEGRIDAKASEEYADMQKELKGFDEGTTEILTTIYNYDEYMKITDDMMAAIEKYNNLPYHFIQNLDTYYIHIHK